MAALGSLVVQLGLNYAQFTGGADAAEQRALQMSKRVQDTMDGLKSGIATTVGAIAGGLAAGFTISAFKGLISGAVETGAALDDLAMQTGASVEALSGLAAVGKYSNQSAESIGGAMNKLAKNMAGATEESKGAGAAVRALGIDFDTFKKQSPDEQLRTIAKAMDGFENSSGKAAVAQALLGKEGAKMLPFFNDLATVGELQAKVTTEQAAAAANFDDNLDRLTSSGDAWKKQLALAMIPALDQGLQAFLDVSNGTGGLRAEIKRLSEDGSIKQFTTNAVTGLTYVADAAQLGWRGIKVMAEGIGAYAAAGVAYFGAVGSAIGKAMKGDFTGALADMRTGMSEAGTIVSDLGESVITTFSEDTMGSRIRARMKDLDALGGGGKEAKKNLDFTNVLDKDKNAAAAAADTMAALIEQIKGRDKLQLAQAKETTADLQSLRKRGALGEIEAIELVAAAEIKALATSRALMADELSVYGKKQNAQKDVAATRARIAEQDEKIGAREKQLNRELLESYAQYNAEADKRLDGRYKDTAALDKQLEQLEFEAKTIGATAEQVRLLEAARTEEMAVALERQAVTRRLIDGNSAEADQLERQADLLRQIAGRKGMNAVAGEAAAEWKTFTDSLYNGLTDSLFRGFEAGKGFFSSFWDGIKNTFKTSILKFMVQAVIGLSGSALGITGATAGALGAAGGGAGGLGLIGNAASLYSGATGAFGIGASQGLAATFTNGGGAAFSTGASMVGSGTAGTAAGIGQMIGAALPYVAVAAIVANVLGVFRSEKKTDVGFKGTLGTSSDVSGFTTIRKGGSLFSGPSYRDELSALPAATKLAIDQSVGSMFTSVKGFSDVLGLNAKAIDGFTKNIFISTEGLSDAQIQEKLTAVFKGLGDDLAGLVAGAALDPFRRAGESAIDTLGRLANSLSGANAIFDSLGQSALQTSLAGGAAASALVDLFGGMENFAAAAGSFLQDFYTPAERAAITTRQLGSELDKLGITTLPTSRAAWRALLEQQDRSTEGGRNMYAALLKLSPVFASITEAAEESTNALQTAAASRQQDIQILELQGNAAGALAARRADELAAMDPLLREKQRYIYSLQDETAAAQAAAAAKAEAAAREKEIGDTRFDYEQRLLRAQGRDREALDRDRAKEYARLVALSPALAVLANGLWLVEDATTAAAAAAEAEAKAKAEREKRADDAYSAVQRAVDARKSVLGEMQSVQQAAVTGLSAIAQSLKTSIADLLGEVGSVASMSAVTGRDYLRKALASGMVGSNEELQAAIAGVRTGMGAENYATREEYDRDRLVLAGQLAQLQSGNGAQLTTAERQLKATQDELKRLDDILRESKSLVDAMKGVDTSVLSVAEAIDRLGKVVGRPVGSAGSAVGGAVVGAGPSGGSGGASSGSSLGRQANGSYVFSDGYVMRQITGTDAARLAGLDSVFAKFAGSGNVAGYYNAAKDAGFSLRDVAAHDGYYYGDVLAAAAGAGVPAFAAGGMHAGGLRIVGERGWELEASGQTRIWNQQQLASAFGSGAPAANDQIVVELKALRTEVEKLRAAADKTEGHTGQLAGQFDQVTAGGNAMLMEEAA